MRRGRQEDTEDGSSGLLSFPGLAEKPGLSDQRVEKRHWTLRDSRAEGLSQSLRLGERISLKPENCSGTNSGWSSEENRNRIYISPKDVYSLRPLGNSTAPRAQASV